MSDRVVICANGHENDPAAPRCETCGEAMEGIAASTPTKITDRRGAAHKPRFTRTWLEAEARMGARRFDVAPWWIRHEVADLERAQSAAQLCCAAALADAAPAREVTVDAVVEWFAIALKTAGAAGLDDPYSLLRRAASVFDAVNEGGDAALSGAVQFLGELPALCETDQDQGFDANSGGFLSACWLATSLVAFATGWKLTDLIEDPSRIERPMATRLDGAHPSATMILTIGSVPFLESQGADVVAGLELGFEDEELAGPDFGLSIPTAPILQATLQSTYLAMSVSSLCGVDSDHPAVTRILGPPSPAELFDDTPLGRLQRKEWEITFSVALGVVADGYGNVDGWPDEAAIHQAALDAVYDLHAGSEFEPIADYEDPWYGSEPEW